MGPEEVRVLVAPHMDLEAGREVYRKAYAQIRCAKPRRILVLGTGHALDRGLFCLTAKDYLTPLGGFPTDGEAVAMLRSAGGDLLAPDDFAHRNEHAVELQVLFLRHVLAGDIPLVPVLFGSFHPHLCEVKRPSEVPGVMNFLRALASLADEGSLVVLGVDFSHVGPKFGHPHSASYYQAEFSEHDQKLLDALCRGSAEDFWAEGRRTGDRFHVCGFPVMACLLEMLPGLSGKMLAYRVWHEPPTRSAVSFAAVALR